MTALIDLDIQSELLKSTMLTAKGRLVAVRERYQKTPLTQSRKDNLDRVIVLLEKLDLALGLLVAPATDHWMLIWSVIEWAEWDVPKHEWQNEEVAHG